MSVSIADTSSSDSESDASIAPLKEWFEATINIPACHAHVYRDHCLQGCIRLDNHLRHKPISDPSCVAFFNI